MTYVNPTPQHRVELVNALHNHLLAVEGRTSMRPGMSETPVRFLKAMDHYTSGYGINPADLLKTFDDGAEHYDQMVLVKDIPVYSLCEHHLAPFFGTAAIAYVPDGRVVGLSKLARVLDAYARRFQVQERLTTQVADLLYEALDPKGVGVLLRCRHMCMESRGVCKAGAWTVTSALRGAMRDDPTARAEFLNLAET